MVARKGFRGSKVAEGTGLIQKRPQQPISLRKENTRGGTVRRGKHGRNDSRATASKSRVEARKKRRMAGDSANQGESHTTG